MSAFYRVLPGFVNHFEDRVGRDESVDFNHESAPAWKAGRIPAENRLDSIGRSTSCAPSFVVPPWHSKDGLTPAYLLRHDHFPLNAYNSRTFLAHPASSEPHSSSLERRIRGIIRRPDRSGSVLKTRHPELILEQHFGIACGGNRNGAYRQDLHQSSGRDAKGRRRRMQSPRGESQPALSSGHRTSSGAAARPGGSETVCRELPTAAGDG